MILPEVSSCEFGLSQRERCLSHHLPHLGLSLKTQRVWFIFHVLTTNDAVDYNGSETPWAQWAIVLKKQK